MNSGMCKFRVLNWLLRSTACMPPVLKGLATEPSKPTLWMLCVIIAVICLPPFHLLTHSLPENSYGEDLTGVAKNIVYWLVSPTKFLRLSALGLALLLPLMSLKLSNMKLRLPALLLSLLVALALAQMADCVGERYPWLLKPLQGNPDRNVDYAACLDAYQKFGLDQYNLPKTIVAAEIRQEQGSIDFKDLAEDKYVSYFGDTPFGIDFSIGPAQMKKSNVVRLAREFPNELKDFLQEPAKSDSPVNLMAALDRKNAAMLVAAYFRSAIGRLEQNKLASPDQKKLINESIASLWKSGTPEFKVFALARTYCPGWARHPAQVLGRVRQLQNPNKPTATQAGE
jgi:hypothetical protein